MSEKESLQVYLGRLADLQPESDFWQTLENRSVAADAALRKLYDRSAAVTERLFDRLARVERRYDELRASARKKAESTRATETERLLLQQSARYVSDCIGVIAAFRAEAEKARRVLADDVEVVFRPALDGLEQIRTIRKPSPSAQKEILSDLLVTSAGLVPVVGQATPLLDIGRSIRAYRDAEGRTGDAIFYLKQAIAYEWLLNVIESQGLANVERLVTKREEEVELMHHVLERFEQQCDHLVSLIKHPLRPSNSA